MRKTSYILAVALLIVHTSSANAGWNHVNRWFGGFWSDGYHSPSDSWNHPQPKQPWQNKTPRSIDQYQPQFPGMGSQSNSEVVIQDSISDQSLVAQEGQYDRVPKFWHFPGFSVSRGATVISQPGSSIQNLPTPASIESNQHLPAETISEPQIRQRINWDQRQQIDLDPPADPAKFGFPTAQWLPVGSPLLRSSQRNTAAQVQQNAGFNLQNQPLPRNPAISLGQNPRTVPTLNISLPTPVAQPQIQLPISQQYQPAEFIPPARPMAPLQAPRVPQPTASPRRFPTVQWPN